MKKCINCGNTENNNASACSRCGGPLMKNSKTCWNCGAEIDAEVAFCNFCGAAMEQPMNPVPYKYDREMLPEKKSRGKGLLITLISAASLLIVVCVVLAFLLISDSGESTKDESNSSSEQTSVENDTQQPNTQEEKPKKSTYQVIKSVTTWTEANASARAMGGYLVCINDAAEFETVCNLANENNLTVFWMGASISSAGQSWYDINWINGDKMIYTKWLPGEPSGKDENDNPERFLMAFRVNKVWYFNDAVNDVSSHYKKMGYIVEFEN